MANRFQTVNSAMGLEQIVAAINRNFRALDSEVYTKRIAGANGKTAMLSGKLPDDTYGILIYDSSGTARTIVGIKSSNGEPIIAESVAGVDVLEALKE